MPRVAARAVSYIRLSGRVFCLKPRGTASGEKGATAQPEGSSRPSEERAAYSQSPVVSSSSIVKPSSVSHPCIHSSPHWRASKVAPLGWVRT